MSLRLLRPLLVCSALCVASHVALAQAKVAVINSQKALFDTAEIKKADADMQATLKPRQDQLEKLNQEMNVIAQKLQNDSTLTQQAQFDLNAEGNRKKTEATRIQEDLQNDSTEMRNNILSKSSEKMQAVIKKLAEDKGLDLVVDVQFAAYWKPAMDITGEATAAYDKTHPVAAAPAAPPAKK